MVVLAFVHVYLKPIKAMIVVTYHLTVETKHFLARGSQWVGDGSHKTREIIHIL